MAFCAIFIVGGRGFLGADPKTVRHFNVRRPPDVALAVLGQSLGAGSRTRHGLRIFRPWKAACGARLFAAALHHGKHGPRQGIDHENPAPADGDRVVAETVLGRTIPERPAGLKIVNHQPRTGGGVTGCLGGHYQQVFPYRNEAAIDGRGSWIALQPELTSQMTVGRIEFENRTTKNQIHAVLAGGIVTADLVGARLMVGVIVVSAQVGKCLLPQ